MIEIFFLIFLAVIWLVFATFQDIRKKEIANWLNFSLIIFAIGFRFFYSLFSDNFNFFYQGLIGVGIFFAIANILYYSRFFAGGDFKLMVALGAILPFSDNLFINIKIFGIFIFLFFIVGSLYTLISSIFLGITHFKKFRKFFSYHIIKNRKLIFISFFVGFALMILGVLNNIFFILAGFVFILPFLYFYVKSVDESCLVRRVNANELTEGDWLYKNVKIGNKIMKVNWNGLSIEDIEKLKKIGKRVWIRHGIPFSPVFLISFLGLIYLELSFGLEVLWNSFW